MNSSKIGKAAELLLEKIRTSELFSIDLRNLALLRLSIGVICLLDLYRRWPYIELFYSNSGLFSNHYALYSNQQPKFSLLYAFSSPEEVKLFFLGTALIAILYTIGFAVRLSGFALLFLMISVINRNPITIYGGDSVLIALLALMQILPVSARWAIERDVNYDNDSRYRSFFVLLLYVQLAVIYFLAGIQKDGATWLSGAGFYYSLFQERIVTILGVFLREHLSHWWLSMFSYVGLAIEVIGGVLILSPWRTRSLRTIAFLLLFALQLLLASTLHIGLFQWTMLAFSLIIFPLGEAVTARPPKTDVCREGPMDSPFKRREVFNLCYGIPLLLAFSVDLMAGNRITRQVFEIERSAFSRVYSDYFSYRQSWGMFSPEAPTGEASVLFEFEMQNGTKIDPLTGVIPNFSQLSVHRTDWTSHEDYLSRLANSEFSYFKVEIERWFRDRRWSSYLTFVDQPKALTVWKIERETPAFEATSRVLPESKSSVLWRFER